MTLPFFIPVKMGKSSEMSPKQLHKIAIDFKTGIV